MRHRNSTQNSQFLPFFGLGAASRSALLAALTLTLVGASVGINAAPPGTADEIRARIAPVGKLCRAGDDCGAVAAPSGPRDGKAVYDGYCFACHATGIGGAPAFADHGAWAPRMEKGMDALWETMQNGLGAMPAKGTCADCTEEELRASLNFMVDAVK